MVDAIRRIWVFNVDVFWFVLQHCRRTKNSSICARTIGRIRSSCTAWGSCTISTMRIDGESEFMICISDASTVLRTGVLIGFRILLVTCFLYVQSIQAMGGYVLLYTPDDSAPRSSTPNILARQSSYSLTYTQTHRPNLIPNSLRSIRPLCKLLPTQTHTHTHIRVGAKLRRVKFSKLRLQTDPVCSHTFADRHRNVCVCVYLI